MSVIPLSTSEHAYRIFVKIIRMTSKKPHNKCSHFEYIFCVDRYYLSTKFLQQGAVYNN